MCIAISQGRSLLKISTIYQIVLSSVMNDFVVDFGSSFWEKFTETWKFWFIAILIPLLCCCCGMYKYKRRKNRRRGHRTGTYSLLLCTCTSLLCHCCLKKLPAKGLLLNIKFILFSFWL